MGPSRVASELRRIASDLERSESPDRSTVSRKVRRVLGAVEGSEEWSVGLTFPASMSLERAVDLARKAIPYETGDWSLEEQNIEDVDSQASVLMQIGPGMTDFMEENGHFDGVFGGVEVTIDSP